MEFPRYVCRRDAESAYRVPTIGGVGIMSVADKAEYDAALASGWAGSIDELRAPVKAAAPAREAAVPPDNPPPTRAEIRQEAKRLGIKFGPNTSDATLLAKIDAAHGGK